MKKSLHPILFAVVALTIGCVNAGLKEPDTTTISGAAVETRSNSRLENIAFLNRSIPVPAHYVSTSFEDLGEKLAGIDENPEMKFIRQQQLNQLRYHGANITLFTDPENPRNGFWIQGGEYVQIDKNLAAEYVGLLDQSIKRQSEITGYPYERTEQNLVQTSGISMIKVKYVLQYENGKQYNTQYLITTDRQTFAIIVSNDEDVDFEDIVKQI